MTSHIKYDYLSFSLSSFLFFILPRRIYSFILLSAEPERVSVWIFVFDDT